MRIKSFVVFFVTLVGAGVARAGDGATTSAQTPAPAAQVSPADPFAASLDQSAASAPANPWAGLSVGAQAFGVSGFGKGAKGGLAATASSPTTRCSTIMSSSAFKPAPAICPG